MYSACATSLAREDGEGSWQSQGRVLFKLTLGTSILPDDDASRAWCMARIQKGICRCHYLHLRKICMSETGHHGRRSHSIASAKGDFEWRGLPASSDNSRRMSSGMSEHGGACS